MKKGWIMVVMALVAAAFLNAGTTGVVHAYERPTFFFGEIHSSGELAAMIFAEGTG